MKAGRRPSNIPKQQIQAEKLYMEGHKKRFIAATVGVSLMTIYRWTEQYGWEEAYKKKYDERLEKIKDPFERIVIMGGKRCPKIKEKIVKNSESNTS